MEVIGVDFTSRPCRAKPITKACCQFDNEWLHIVSFEDITSFDGFEALLQRPEPWIAGIDLPFGQSRKLVTNLGWPLSWSGYVELVASMSREEFVEVLESYKAPRSKGDKEHRRLTDERAGAISPQKLYGVPVGKMFYEGARRLLCSAASIEPVRPTSDGRVIVEAYPALVARRWAGRGGYKTDTKSKQSEAHRIARIQIVDGLVSDQFQEVYGYALQFSDHDRDRMIDDSTGDQLDAVLCAVQATWAWLKRNEGYGIPENADLLEGWIIDPALITT